MKLVDCVKGSVTFDYARDGALWYKTDNGLIFPVPFEDVGIACFMAKDKGIFYMRWIRKYLEDIENEKVSN
jgi:hypothetical protein